MERVGYLPVSYPTDIRKNLRSQYPIGLISFQGIRHQEQEKQGVVQRNPREGQGQVGRKNKATFSCALNVVSVL
jgi:hypothetical protein